MCGRYSITTPVEALRQTFLFEGTLNLQPRYNVAPTQDPTASRMTIVTRGDDATLEQIIKQLNKLPESLEVTDFRANEFVDRVKAEVFEDRVYVFTPEGQVIDLPAGATPIDFAYAIHTEVGNRCRGAKVNGRIVPLTYQLQNGEQVEVLTVKKGGPSRDWLSPHLGYIKTPRARSRIQRWFRQENYEQNVQLGRQILEKELHRMALHGVNFEKLARKLNLNKADDMFRLLAEGKAVNRPRARVRAERLLLHVMPAGSAELGYVGLQAYTTAPSGARRSMKAVIASRVSKVCVHRIWLRSSRAMAASSPLASMFTLSASFERRSPRGELVSMS